MFEDKTLVCKECGQEFVFTAGEQEFYASKGLTNEPKRCKSCRRPGKVYVCADCGGIIAPALGKTAEYLSMYTHKTYGKELCAECATKEKAKLDAQKAPDPFNNNQEENI